MIGIPLGLMYSNAGEWLIHKYILHGLGKKKGSFWRFHWGDHHGIVRKTDGYDPHYLDDWFSWGPKTKEAVSLAALMAAHAPLFPIAPFFTGAVWYSGLNYYYKHRKAHLDPHWCKEHMPWHYDHHMAPNQDANWCVTKPWFDQILGTREVYYNTETYREDQARRARAAAERAARAEQQQAQRQDDKNAEAPAHSHNMQVPPVVAAVFSDLKAKLSNAA